MWRISQPWNVAVANLLFICVICVFYNFPHWSLWHHQQVYLWQWYPDCQGKAIRIWKKGVPKTSMDQDLWTWIWSMLHLWSRITKCVYDPSHGKCDHWTWFQNVWRDQIQCWISYWIPRQVWSKDQTTFSFHQKKQNLQLEVVQNQVWKLVSGWLPMFKRLICRTYQMSIPTCWMASSP